MSPSKEKVTRPSAYLLTWNPKNSRPWKEMFGEAYRGIKNGYVWLDNWSLSKNFRKIRHGDDLWFLRQGEEPKGIFAYATVVGSPYEASSWKNPNELAFYINYEMDWLVNPETQFDEMFLRDELKSDPRFLNGNWDPRGSGDRIPDYIAQALWNDFE